MWNTPRKGRELVEECRHPERIATDTAGLQRSVCADCGHVSVGYLYDVFADQVEQLAFDTDADQS